MPFTPFHLGPALLIALLLFPLIDIFVICVASVIIDIEPAYYLFIAGRGAYHGFLHTLLGGTLISLLMSPVLYYMRKLYLKIIDAFGLKQDTSFKKIVASSLIGVYGHILLDSFLYPEMNPLYPLQGNPLLYLIPAHVVYEICILSFLLAIPLYIYRIKKQA